MALFFAVGVALVASPLVSHVYPGLFRAAQNPLDDKRDVVTPQLSAFIQETLVLENISGLSVAVVQKLGKREPELHTWGHRTEGGDAVTPDTLFHMASVSKAFCATALGLLIDDFANGDNVTALPSGMTELTWHTRPRDLLPDWQLMDAWASERTNLRDMLSHVSGLPRHDVSYGPEDTPRDMVARLRYLRPAFELREQWLYNNIMYMVAAHVVATYSGQSYTSFVQERIFAPLGMVSSTFSPTEAEASGKFTQGWTQQGRRVPECFTEDMACMMAGTGGIISNAVDMAKWISTWIDRGVYDNQTIFPPSVYRNVSYAYSVSADHPSDPEHSIVGYGMGWFRSSYRGHDVVYHPGSLPGLSTLVSFLPGDEIGVTLFANGENQAASLMLILNRILDSALDLTSSLALVRTSPTSPNATKTEPGAKVPPSFSDALAGTYADPGYGSFTLCGPSSPSSYCANVRSNFTIVDGARGDPDLSGDLLAEWPRVWSSHVRMRHKEGSVFAVYFTALYPHGYGKDATPFETRWVGSTTECLAEFVVDGGEVVGFGMSGLDGEVTERARKGKTVRERAEVWFGKV